MGVSSFVSQSVGRGMSAGHGPIAGASRIQRLLESAAQTDPTGFRVSIFLRLINRQFHYSVHSIYE